MKIIDHIKHPATVVLAALFIGVVSLIIFLDAQVVAFSRKVTDFYAPTVHQVKSFEAATAHIQEHLRQGEPIDQSSILLLRQSTDELVRLSQSWDPAYRQHIEGMLGKSYAFISEASDRGARASERLLPALAVLHEEAAMHVRMHDTELEKARSGIQKSTFLIHFTSLLLLLAGGLIVIREVRVQRELYEKSVNLADLNRRLEDIVKEEVRKRMEQEQLLIQQSRLAAMGEMLGFIAHQWRSPLNAMSLMMQLMEEKHREGCLDKDTVDFVIEKSTVQLEYMNKAIGDFRNFLKPSMEKTFFGLRAAVEDVLNIISAQLRFNCVELSIKHADCDIRVYGYPNEFKHVVLNILNNARDAVVERKQRGLMKDGESGRIILTLEQNDKTQRVLIEDNGGGIPAEALEKMFAPYFTTKDDKGTGIGLYMAKVIIENNMNGRIYAENSENGARFVIELRRAG